MKKLVFLAMLVMALGLFPVAGQATTTMYDSLAAWTAAVSPPVTAVAIPFAEGAGVPAGTAIALPAGSVSFNIDTICYQVPSSWATWSNGNSPTVLYTQGSTTMTGAFTAGQMAFGLELEPDNFAVESMTLSLAGGPSLTQDVNGNAGAAFFGWVSNVGYTSMTLTDNVGDDFAMGRMVSAPSSAVPVPPTVLLGSGLAGLGMLRRKWSLKK